MPEMTRDQVLQRLRKGEKLERADLRGLDLSKASLAGAALARADLEGANLEGARLPGVRNLTQEQLDVANGDDQTVLPAGLTRPAHWSKAQENEGPPAAQPDDAGGAPAEVGAPGSDK